MLIIVLLDFRPRVYIGFSGPENDIDRNKRTVIILLHKSQYEFYSTQNTVSGL
jgi:hypothetical protein